MVNKSHELKRKKLPQTFDRGRPLRRTFNLRSGSTFVSLGEIFRREDQREGRNATNVREYECDAEIRLACVAICARLDCRAFKKRQMLSKPAESPTETLATQAKIRPDHRLPNF